MLQAAQITHLCRIDSRPCKFVSTPCLSLTVFTRLPHLLHKHAQGQLRGLSYAAVAACVWLVGQH